jgi:predicted lipoprotein with Yx(FWY)xxD motif
MQSTDGVKAAAAQDENSSACNNKVWECAAWPPLTAADSEFFYKSLLAFL